MALAFLVSFVFYSKVNHILDTQGYIIIFD